MTAQNPESMSILQIAQTFVFLLDDGVIAEECEAATASGNPAARMSSQFPDVVGQSNRCNAPVEFRENVQNTDLLITMRATIALIELKFSFTGQNPNAASNR